jgi:hypothetical protein
MTYPSSHSAILKVTPGSETDRFLSNSMNLGRPITYFYKPHDIVGRRYNCDENLIEYDLSLLSPTQVSDSEKNPSDPMVPSPPQPSPDLLTLQQMTLYRALRKPQHQSVGIVGLSR